MHKMMMVDEGHSRDSSADNDLDAGHNADDSVNDHTEGRTRVQLTVVMPTGRIMVVMMKTLECMRHRNLRCCIFST